MNMEFKDLYKTVNQYAEQHDIKPASLALWVEKAKKAGEIRPYMAVGNTNLYAVADLAEARIKYERKPAQPKVHPDQHREVVEHRDRLAVALVETEAALERVENKYVELEEKYNNLLANFNGQAAELSALQKIEKDADEFAESVISG